MCNRYSYWFALFSTIIEFIEKAPIGNKIRIILAILSIILSFIFPLVSSMLKKSFNISTTLGNTNLRLQFGTLFDEEYIVITTTRYYDINPKGGFASENSVAGIFVNKFCKHNARKLEQELQSHLGRDNDNNLLPAEYGDYIKKEIEGKTIYFLVFTDRLKTDQPADFYTETLGNFLNKIINENHGKAIAMPLIGDNNNLSDSGFTSSEMTFKSLIAMINHFEISHQRSQLKLTIVALPEKRSELIGVISEYSK